MIVEERQVTVLEVPERHIVFIGEQGLPGPTGPVGPAGSAIQTLTAGEALGGHRFVVSDAAGNAIYADQSIATHANKVLGMTTGAALLGASVQIQQSGEYVEPTWTWALDTPIWLGLSGLMTQTAPTTGFSMIVGFPITSTKILIAMREPIFLN